MFWYWFWNALLKYCHVFYYTFQQVRFCSQNGIRQIDTVDQAALALKPLAGNMTYLLFALGMLGTGFLAIPVCRFPIVHYFGIIWMGGRTQQKISRSKGFYLVIIISLVIALAINFIESVLYNPWFILLFLYGITALFSLPWFCTFVIQENYGWFYEWKAFKYSGWNYFIRDDSISSSFTLFFRIEIVGFKAKNNLFANSDFCDICLATMIWPVIFGIIK